LLLKNFFNGFNLNAMSLAVQVVAIIPLKCFKFYLANFHVYSISENFTDVNTIVSLGSNR
jgi:hypothetical protein